MANWTTPTNFAAEEIVTSTKLNEQVIQNLLYLYEGGAQWTTFTPTFNNVTLGTSSAVYGRYRRLGDIVEFQAGFTLGTGGSVAGAISMTGPLTTAAAPSGFAVLSVGVAAALDASTSNRYAGGFYVNPSSTTWAGRLFSDGQVGWTTADPFTWTVSDALHLTATITVT